MIKFYNCKLPLQITFNRTEFLQGNGTLVIEYIIDDLKIADVSSKTIFSKEDLENSPNDIVTSSFNVTGKFLGYAKVQAKAEKDNVFRVSDEVKIAVSRVKGPLDKAFTYSVAALVAIIYINMGAALDTRIVLDTMKKPIGPIIGFTSQFLLMPLASVYTLQLNFLT